MKKLRRLKCKWTKVYVGILVIVLSVLAGYGVYYIKNTYADDKFNNVEVISNLNYFEEINIEDNNIEENNLENNNLEENFDDSKLASKETNKKESTVESTDSNIETNIKVITEEYTEGSTEKNERKNMDEGQGEANRAKVKGIYVTGPKAGSRKYMDELIELVDTTEVNAMVIDIKNDSGEITYSMDLPMVEEIGASKRYIRDIEGLIQGLKDKNIYLIARIVAFKDPILAKEKPELSIKNSDGSIFRDKAGHAWVNPYNRQVWEYLMDVSKKTVELGFDEIQYDYIRFSTDSRMKNVSFGEEAENKSKIDVITEFTKYAYDTLKPLNVYVSADVYGAIIDSEVDAQIVGQDYKEMAKYLDYICPMVYPSHYAYGAYGIEYPDLEPYQLILKSMEASKKVLDEIPEEEHKAIVRPWLQDFTASWIKHHKKYGGQELKDQMKGVYDSGYEEWILWNGSNNYTISGLELVK